MDALQAALARALAMLPRPLQDAAAGVGAAAFDVAMAGVEAGLVPDSVIRRGIRALLRQRDGEVRGVEGVWTGREKERRRERAIALCVCVCVSRGGAPV